MKVTELRAENTFPDFKRDLTKHHKRKKGSSKLPDDFYEKILISETCLLQSLKLDNLQEVLQLYMTGLEYYECKDTNKALGFQSRANWMLSKPEIVQLLQKKQKDNIKEEDDPDFLALHLIKTLKRRISLQKKLSQENDKVSLEELCQKILKEIASINGDRVIVENVIQTEFENQKKTLLERLKKRKANQENQNLNLGDNFTTFQRTNNENENENQQCNLYDITEINSISSKSNHSGDESLENTSTDGKGNDLSEKMQSPYKDLDTPRSKNRKGIRISTFNKSSSTMEHITNLIHSHLINGTFGSKQKEMLLLIKEKIDEYLFSYNEYFYEEHYREITKKIEQLFAEKYRKYIQISKTYQDQIKETQYELLNAENFNDEQIELIVSSLSEEKDHELSKLDDEYNNLLKDYIASFKALGFKQNKTSVQYLQEKAKLDIYNCLLSLFTS